MIERARKVPHHEHDRADINQHQNARKSDSFGQRHIHPRARCQFGRSGEEHDREEHPKRWPLERFGHHLAEGHARCGAGGLRKPVPHGPQAEDDAGDDRQGDQHLPFNVQLAEKQHRQQPANNDPARPPRVQRVQLAGLVIGVQRGSQRVDRGFGSAPAEPPDDHREVEHGIDRSACASGCQHQRRADDEAGGGEQNHLLRADPVEQRADHQQAEREPEEAVAQHRADHLARMGRVDRIEQRCFHRPRCACADGIGQRGGEQREHANPVDCLAVDPAGRLAGHYSYSPKLLF